MENESNKKRNWKIIRNALIIGSISGVSQCLTSGGPNINSIYAGFMTAVLVALIELKYAYKITPLAERNKKAMTTFFFK